MSPVDLIRELAEALQTHLPPAVDAHPPNWTAHTVTLTRAQAFLAANTPPGIRAIEGNPVNMIQRMHAELSWVDNAEPYAERAPERAAMLTESGAFLAARPVVIETPDTASIVGELWLDDPAKREFRFQGYSPGMVCASANGLLDAVPAGTPCTVHVIVVPSAREP